MTDAEIIKALSIHSDFKSNCEECAFQGDTFCVRSLTGEALNLIERQRSKIENLEKREYPYTFIMQSRGCGKLAFERTIKNFKAEAVKEFAEKLKMCAESSRDYSQWVFSINESQLDNLVKEMTGGAE